MEQKGPTGYIGAMTTTIQIEKLSRAEKLQTMEALWEALSRMEDEVESPAWHRDVLKETEARVAAGRERIADWEVAKRELRKRFE
jgi:hypothetical protein